MTDRHDEDNETNQRAASAPSIAGEGVRIIGAEEAQAAVESGAAAHRLGLTPRTIFAKVKKYQLD